VGFLSPVLRILTSGVSTVKLREENDKAWELYSRWNLGDCSGISHILRQILSNREVE
jgi:hypothetical protein